MMGEGVPPATVGVHDRGMVRFVRGAGTTWENKELNYGYIQALWDCGHAPSVPLTPSSFESGGQVVLVSRRCHRRASA